MSLRGCSCRGLPVGDELTDAVREPLGDGAVDAAAEFAALDCADPLAWPRADLAGRGRTRRLGAMSDVAAALFIRTSEPPRPLLLLLLLVLMLRRRTGVA